MTIATAPVLLRLPDVERVAGIKRSTIYKMEGDGQFPRRVPLGGRMVAWVESEVRGWVAERIAERDAMAA